MSKVVKLSTFASEKAENTLKNNVIKGKIRVTKNRMSQGRHEKDLKQNMQVLNKSSMALSRLKQLEN